ncbi:uncharacterized protein LOC133301348 [Gastrolobium bilobum]|uniref:uncharacterized protein LOC133301348 n=1 Tax=Gastrolobium bilobum TaxID=150636 RepID=UPI002AB27735|nr:uncharacterized protein LOC133301348 [Gastrolobium bilobum]
MGQAGEDDPLCPRLILSAEEHKRDCEQWRKALIIKLLGKRISPRFLLTRLRKSWNLVSSFEAIDLDNGFLFLRFQEDGDYRHVLEEGPWIVNDHCVVVQRWRPFFDPYDESVTKLAVWISVPGLPIQLYKLRTLWRIGNFFGRTLKVDRNSLRKSDLGEDLITERARFARICVEVDLRKSFLSKFVVGSKVYPVGYEGLHLICFKCGMYGHRKDQCPADQVACPHQMDGSSDQEKGLAGGHTIEQKERQPKSRKLKAIPVLSGKVVQVQNPTLVDPGSKDLANSHMVGGESSGLEDQKEAALVSMEADGIGGDVGSGIPLLSPAKELASKTTIKGVSVESFVLSPQKKGRTLEAGTKKNVLKEGKDRTKPGIKQASKKNGIENVPPVPVADGLCKGTTRSKLKNVAGLEVSNTLGFSI